MPKNEQVSDDFFNADQQVKLKKVHEVIEHPDKFSDVFVLL